ncbi:hypothetical protein HBKIJOIA_00049 [Salmonella phage S1]|nr:hypothetical protein HBKIJOIA_00049 [Salmonella phage S1]
MRKPNFGIRARIEGGVVELWIGTPDEAESECIAHFHTDYLPGVLEQLNNLHKVPTKAERGLTRPVSRPSHSCMQAARKLMGVGEFNTPGNYLVGDGYFANDCRKKFGEKNFARACELVRDER